MSINFGGSTARGYKNGFNIRTECALCIHERCLCCRKRVIVHAFLKCKQYHKLTHQFARLTLSASGMEFMVDSGDQVCQAHGYLYSSLFDQYEFHPPENWLQFEQRRLPHDATLDTDETLQPCVTFDIHLESLFKVLQVFLFRKKSPGNEDTVMIMDFPHLGGPMGLRMSQGTWDMSFHLRTYDAPFKHEMDFDSAHTAAQVIVDSQQLCPLLNEIYKNGEKAMRMEFYPAASRAQGDFLFCTENSHGTTEIVFPNKDAVTEKYMCDEPVVQSYALKGIEHMLAALTVSDKTSIRIDEVGMLSVQFKLPLVCRQDVDASQFHWHHGFIEFLCCPLVAST